MNTITVEPHPSVIYPRKIHGQKSAESICPACHSHNVDVITHSPENKFKRQSTCAECSTVWSTRNMNIPRPYEQSFYQKSQPMPIRIR